MAITIEQVRRDLRSLSAPNAEQIAHAVSTADTEGCSPDSRTLLGLQSLSAISNAAVRAWVVGGWVGDSYAGRPLRQHYDIDLLAMAEEQDQVLAGLEGVGCRIDPQNEWQHG